MNCTALILNVFGLGRTPIGIAATCLGLQLLQISSLAAEIHVSPKGNDSDPGTVKKPVATFERARELVRQNKKSAGPITVWIHEGDYLRNRAFELGPEDSGTSAHPILWKAASGAKVRWLGGMVLSGFEPVRDAAVRERLTAEAATKVVQLDLKKVGVESLGEMKSRGFSRPTHPAHNELFVDGKPMTLARWPNEGSWEKIAGFPETQGRGDDHGGKIGDLVGGFQYAGDRPRGWKDVSDLWVHGYWAWDWANSYEKVQSLDLEKRLVTTAAPHGLYGFRAGQRFHFLNILEELDQPGEYYIDKARSMLYFWPPDRVEKSEVILSVMDQPLIRTKETSFVRFEGIHLEATRGSGVEVSGGESVILAGCTLRDLGDLGVSISGGKNHKVTGCEILDTGDGGVSLDGGNRQTLTPAGHVVEHCHFQRQGRWSKCYVPAVLMNGVGHRVSHCHIHDHPHCAILFNGNDHLIEFNNIHHIALETGDVGAIYTGRDYSYRGNRIRHNYIHETGGVGMGSMGVYMDDCVSGTEVYGNIFYQVHWAMFIGGGRDHRVDNNLFVECDPAVRADARGLDTSPVWRSMVEDYMRKQLAAVPAALYRERYPEIKTLDAFYGAPGGPAIGAKEFKGIPASNNVVKRNVCVGKWMDVGWHAKTEMFEVGDNFVTADLAHVGREKEGYKIPQDSPAWKTGFKAIRFEDIGLQIRVGAIK